MSPRADLALYDCDGQLTVAVEVKNKLGTSAEWAAKLRRNLLAHGGFYGGSFFLLVTPDRVYLWKGADAEPDLSPPTYEIDATPLFAAYFTRAGALPGEMSSQAFELVVAAWLSELVRSEERPKDLADTRRWLAESGLLSAVKNGRIEYEVAA